MGLQEIFDLNDQVEASIKSKNYTQSIHHLNEINQKLGQLIEKNNVPQVKQSLGLMISANDTKIDDLRKVLTMTQRPTKEKSATGTGNDQLETQQDLFNNLDSQLNSLINTNTKANLSDPEKQRIISSNTKSMDQLIVENYLLNNTISSTNSNLESCVRLIRSSERNYKTEIDELVLENKKLNNKIEQLKKRWNNLIESARKRRQEEVHD